jgi:UDP-GlcNAc:undecaprenyl-phosphate GlcNAc-1-phosphate transferase
MLLLAIPIMDTLFAILRRLINHKPIGEPDKNHFHHQLLKLNLSKRKTVLIIYLIDILFALASILYAVGNRMLGTNIYGIIIYVILLMLTLVLVLRTNIIWEHKKRKINKGTD